MTASVNERYEVTDSTIPTSVLVTIKFDSE
jgi:hypothetical protein